MKYILFTLTIFICFLSFCQNGILYIDRSSSLFKFEMDAFLNENNPQSLINFLKKELRRSEISGESESIFEFNFNMFADGYQEDQFKEYFDSGREGDRIIKGYIQVAGLEPKFLSDLIGDTNSLKIKSQYCMIENDGTKYCNAYHSLEDIEGVVFLEEDFSQENRFEGEEEDNTQGEVFYERGFYSKTRIGFVRTFKFKNELNPNEIIEKKCITFSIPISSLENMGWGYKFENDYMNLKKKSLKHQKNDIYGKELFFMDYSNVKEIAKTFYYSTSKYKDLHFGIQIFQY
jgi:hypothetical protein